ncbi:unnamed protein product, partial [Mesorhabditis belari]|uniref:Transthyretin-like protein 5 n=1 Tax=Mesorhabditis belari TaxID=2138241 RepID=A0AAF3FKY0_9BILA
MFTTLLIFCLLFLKTSNVYCALLDNGVKNVAVRGRVTCNGLPLKNVQVLLSDQEQIDEAKTDWNGYFQLTSKTSKTAPNVMFYHSCNNGKSRCQRRFTKNIPVSTGSITPINYDFGMIELSAKRPDEINDCSRRKRK